MGDEMKSRNFYISFQKLSKTSQHLQESCSCFINLKLNEWTKDYISKALNHLSNLVFDSENIKFISNLFTNSIIEIVTLALKQNVQHHLKCIMLGRLIENHPQLLQTCLTYFENNEAPWFLNNSSKLPKKKKIEECKDLEIVECCLTFLQVSIVHFKMKWNWSEFINDYINNNNKQVVWIVCQCITKLFSMNEKSKAKLLKKYFTDEEIKKYTILYERKAMLSHPLNVDLPKLAIESSNEDNYSSTFSSTTEFTVNVCGVTLPVFNKDQQVKNGCLIPVKSTSENLRKVAIGISTSKAVCLFGPVGCGKSALVDHLALITGRCNGKELLKVQLGEETDSKLLLGTYKCTDIPGEFIWESGVLTKAIMGGHWLLIEDIESATSDVAAVLSCLLEQNMLSVPGFRENVQAAPGFQLFMTHRLQPGLNSFHRKQTSATELLEKHWLHVNMEQLTRDELINIIQIKFPSLKTIASRMVSVYLLFSMGHHEESEIIEQSAYRGGRLISTRDLMKWCTRAEMGFDVSSQESALKVLQDAIDIFCLSYSDPAVRLELAEKVAACLGIIKTKSEYYCNLYKPQVSFSRDSCLAGRVTLPKLITDEPASIEKFSHSLKFALTRESCCLLEHIAVCLSLKEPVLLVGETGTGKTSTIQLLAKHTGHNLVVINMNQQSDSSDLLGGYKPVDIKQVMLPLRDEFEKLFRLFFNVQENLKFLENISVCFNKRMWSTLLKLMAHSQSAAVKRLIAKNNNAELLSQWRNLGDKIYKLQSQLDQGQAAMAFSFIEGSLVQALKQGDWVLLDEINLASAETLQCLSGLLEGSSGSISLLERGDKIDIPRHSNFRLLAAMNPANDFGKKDLPLGIRNRFTEFFVSEYTEKNDLNLVVNCYLPNLPANKVDVVVEFYLNIKRYAKDVLSDSMGHKPVYSLRTLCRALVVASANLCGTIQRSLYEALCLSFLTQLNADSHNIVKNMIAKTVLDKSTAKSILTQPLPEPSPKGNYVSFEGYWVPKGPSQPYISKKYLLTASVRRNLCDIARCVSLSNHPVLIQGETSVGKTSLITYLAQASGHKCFRINNHQHTDLQEYVGSYIAEPSTGNLVFKEGVLVEAMRHGHWIILDELNLAPSEVLEALNRVLDDNRELFIPETQTLVKAHPNFRLFATQNPPGLYGGRKMLSRAFRNRFIELHFDEIPAAELEEILHHRCDMPKSYCKKMVAVMGELQVRRKGSAAFAGKQGYITLRDLFRWGERYRLANQPVSGKYYDWDQHIADEGYLVLAGRVRKDEEAKTIKEVLEKKINRTVDLEKLFTLNSATSPVTKHVLEKVVATSLPEDFQHIVWTYNFRRLAVLVGKALEFSEPVLLIGDTGCGKTTICQLLTTLNNQIMFSVNCHQHSESADFLGGLRPVRDKIEGSGRLFEWVDGPLVNAMKTGQIFLADEISLADDSVLERLNSLLEPERILLISEKGSGDDLEIIAEKDFRFISTMNPGGDFGKKELSPALRNRLSEIWCEGPKNQNDLIQIIEHNVKSGLFFGNQQDGSSGVGIAIYNFVQWLKSTEFGKRLSISIRDILTWVKFINFVLVDESSEKVSFDVATAYVHGACLTFLDAIGTAGTAMDNLDAIKCFKKMAVDFLITQVDNSIGFHSNSLDVLIDPASCELNIIMDGKFGIHPFYIERVPGTNPVEDFRFEAPTTRLNTLRLLRALQISSRAILLEGNPGVGKTSVVMALSKVTGNKVTRINLSEQTDISDLFGADLPVEGATGGTFAWRDGPFLKALKEGHWILLDELNLASQSVVEGLNSVLDHRGEIFIPELGKTFTLKQRSTKIFACQNPQRQGGARKGLPQSFLNRFTQVFMEPLTSNDYKTILCKLHPNIPVDIIEKMIEFNMILVDKAKGGWGFQGAPWEWNLRDLTYWIRTIERENPGTFMSTIYADRMRTKEDKNDVLRIYEEVFGPKYPLIKDVSPLLINEETVTFGEVSLSRNLTRNEEESLINIIDRSNELLLLRNQLPVLRSLALCVKMGWMAILVGNTYTGKSSIIQVLAQLVGQKLYSIPVSSAMDTTELLGAFEQTDYGRHLDAIGQKVEKLVSIRGQTLILEGNYSDAVLLLHAWYIYCNEQQIKTGETEDYTLVEAVKLFNKRLNILVKVLKLIPSSEQAEKLLEKLDQLELLVENHGLKAGGTFEWIDSILVKCLEEGHWLVIDNVNLCSSAVLDRLNGLLETGGVLTLGERGIGTEGEIVVKPHPNFRIFLTMDPKHGTISRAMRNRGIEIYVEPTTVSSVPPFDLEALLHKSGIKLHSHRVSLIEIHEKLLSVSHGPDKPNLNHLLHTAFLIIENCRNGFSLQTAVEISFTDVYLKSRILTKEQKALISSTLSEAFKYYKKIFLDENCSSLDCFRPETKTISTKDIQENSIFASIKQQCSLLLAIIELLETIMKSKTWPRNISSYQLNDLISFKSYELNLPDSVSLDSQIISAIPSIVISYYNLASNNDLEFRHLWIEENVKQLFKNNFTIKIAEQILKVSEIVSNILTDCIQNNNNNQPWDFRQIKCENILSDNKNWSNENKLILLIFYKVILGLERHEEEIEGKKLNWQTITILEYSHLLKKGLISDLPTNQLILCEIFTFIEQANQVIIEILSDKNITINNVDCCKWLYNLAWKFRLSYVADRRMFVTSKSVSSNVPIVCEETLRLIILHYKWFRKYTLPMIIQALSALDKKSETASSFFETVKKFDDYIEINKINLIPLSRKIMRTLHQPSPHKTTRQCDLSKIIQRIVIVFEAWKKLPTNEMLRNFIFMSNDDDSLRDAVSKFSEKIHSEIFDSENDLKKLETIEKMFKNIQSSKKDLTKLKNISFIKLWPFQELICLQLNMAARVYLSDNTEKSNYVNSILFPSLKTWLETTEMISPDTVGTINAFLKSDELSMKNSMQLLFLLTEHMNHSVTLMKPFEFLTWNENDASENSSETSIERYYPMNSPLLTLYLGKLIKTSARSNDMTDLALKEHSDTINSFKKLKLMLWKNLNSIFSDELDIRSNEEFCLKNSIIQLLQVLIKHLLPNEENNYKNLSCENLCKEYIPKLIQTLNTSVSFNLPEAGSPSSRGQSLDNQIKPITNSLNELIEVIDVINNINDYDIKSIGIGKAWLLIGHIYLMFFSKLELVDPVQKKAIKRQYSLEEINELRILLCVESLNKTILGGPKEWPLKLQYENRILELSSKATKLNKAVAVRPCPSQYNSIVNDLNKFLAGIVSNEVFTRYTKNLLSTSISQSEKESLINDGTSWLKSLISFKQSIFQSYYVTYPDIVTPILLSVSQMIYGMKLVSLSNEKVKLNNECGNVLAVQNCLQNLCIYPIPNLNSVIDLINLCSSTNIIKLLNKSQQVTNNGNNYDRKTKLAKICVRLIMTLVESNLSENIKEDLFKTLEFIVESWNLVQHEQQVKLAQEQSIYINKLTPIEIEEEEIKRDISELFPTNRDEDFGDIENVSSLEYQPESKLKSKKDIDKLTLTENDIKDICEIHSQIVKTNAKAHWINRNNLNICCENNNAILFNERINIFIEMIDALYLACDKTVDSVAIPSMMLALNNSMQTNCDNLAGKKYDFYRDANVSEAKHCNSLLEQIKIKIQELLAEWPEHPTLKQIDIVVNRVLNFSITSPISRFLTGLEILLTRLHDWEENAHDGVSLASHTASLTEIIIKWRKLELTAWKGALNSTLVSVQEKASKWWFYIYSLIVSYLNDNEDNNKEEELICSLENFMESAPLGEYSVRLNLLWTFHCHCLILPKCEKQENLCKLFWNLYSYYKIFTTAIKKKIKDLGEPIEKKLKDFVKIARWNDINYWAIKSAIEKTHRTIHKHIKEYQKILFEPSNCAMTKLQEIKENQQVIPNVNFVHYLTSFKINELDIDQQSAEDSLLSKLESFLRKSRRISKECILQCPYPKLLNSLLELIEDVKDTEILINDREIDQSLTEEKKRSAAKALLQRKRKSITDIFKILAQLGLSYRTGLLAYEHKNIKFTTLPPLDISSALKQIDPRQTDADWLISWNRLEDYFYTSVALLAQLKTVLVKPHQDLGPQIIERTKGFSSHCMKLIQEMKISLSHNSVLLFRVRCLLSQLKNIFQDSFGICDVTLHQQKETLKSLLNDTIFCVEQFEELLNVCPEHDLKEEEVNAIPSIFPLNDNSGIVNGFKYSDTWQQAKDRVDSVLKTCKIYKQTLDKYEKNEKFSRIIQENETEEEAVDIIKSRNYSNVINDGYTLLKQISLDLFKIEELFQTKLQNKTLNNPFTSSINILKTKLDNEISMYTKLNFPEELHSSQSNQTPEEILEFENTVEIILHKTLITMQKLYKNYVQNGSEENEDKTEEIPVEISSDRFQDNHVKVKIYENLLTDSNALNLKEIENLLTNIFFKLRSISTIPLNVSCQRLLVRLFPQLDQLTSLSQFIIIQQTSAVKVLSKLQTSLLALLLTFAQNGYNIPEGLIDNEEGEGLEMKGGLGLGDGEGEKDVSDQIESQDQLEDAKKPGEYDNEEDKDCPEEEKGIEMEDDIGGKLQDLEKKGEGEEDEDDKDEDKDEHDKEMGETDKGDDILDKEIWGSDSEEEQEENEEKPKDAEGNQGAEETKEEMGAKEEDDKPGEDKKSNESKREPKRDEINEEEDGDEEQVDPYHNQRPQSPEIEPLELEDQELNLDNDMDLDNENDEEEEIEKNPFDIDEMKDENLDKEEEEDVQENEEGENDDKDDGSDDNDNENEENVAEPQLKENEKESNEEETEENEEKKDDNEEMETEEAEEKTAEDTSVPDSTPSASCAESSEQKLAQDQVSTNNKEMDNSSLTPQDSTAVGEEESGTGSANNANIIAGGHKGKIGEEQPTGNQPRQEKRNRPGQSDTDRSLGEMNEPALKKLKAVDTGDNEDKSVEDSTKENSEQNPSSDLYQHIREAQSSQFDAQIIDAATKEQAEKQPVPNKEDEEAEDLKQDDDIMDIDEEDKLENDVPKVKPDNINNKASDDKQGQPSKEGEVVANETSVEVEGEIVETHGVPRGALTTFHTRQEELDADTFITEAEILSLRVRLEQELASWSQPPDSAEAVAAWEKLCSVTSNLAKDLSEQLRLVLEPTTASGLKGDFRTGRRINMRKVIPYIASQFRKDKIWLRRTKPSKREYQIILAIDDSSSMADNHSKELAFESLALVSRALNLLEAGDLGVLSFGESVKVLHQLGEPFNEYSGAKLLQQFSFDQKKTKVGALVDFASALLHKSMKRSNADVAQLLIIVSDGRGVLSEGEASIRASVRKAKHQNIFMVFVIIDNPESKNSILDIRMPRFKDGKLVEITSYMDNFPFPFYLILKDINYLPSVLSDALRQWFELVTNLQ